VRIRRSRVSIISRLYPYFEFVAAGTVFAVIAVQTAWVEGVKKHNNPVIVGFVLLYVCYGFWRHLVANFSARMQPPVRPSSTPSTNP
jgi:hypothetical protein